MPRFHFFLGFSANTTLKWLGFSWRGMVLVQDSSGALKGLTHQFDWQWNSVFDFNSTAKGYGTSEWYSRLASRLLQVLTNIPASARWITSVDYEEVRGVPIHTPEGQPATYGIMKHPVPVAFTPQVDAVQVGSSSLCHSIVLLSCYVSNWF